MGNPCIFQHFTAQIMRHIFILSDGTGRTAEQTVRAALTQFNGTDAHIEIRPKVRTQDQVSDIIFEARKVKGLIVHTIVSEKLRDYILKRGRLYDVDTIDLMGPLLAQMSDHFTFSPSEKPGLFNQLNKAYFQRIEGMEFAFRHDDGMRTEELKKADIVLLGVSRTFKTPLSIYLAFRGWLVANIPIVMGIDPPEIIYELSPKRVFCLTTNPSRLAQLRRARDAHFGGSTGDYANPAHVREEVQYALRLYQRNLRWSIIDVTNKPIEEIASEILNIIRKRRPHAE